MWQYNSERFKFVKDFKNKVEKISELDRGADFILKFSEKKMAIEVEVRKKIEEVI